MEKEGKKSAFTVWSQPYLKGKQEKRLEGNKSQEAESEDRELLSILSQ